MNNLDKQYKYLIRDILENGVEKSDRTGTGTISVFGRQIRHKMPEGFPLLTTKKLSFKNIWTELRWFLNGDTNIKYLLENGNYIWVGDAYKRFHNSFPEVDMLSREDFIQCILDDSEFAERWGYMGMIYGAQWRSWNGKIDQIKNLLEEIKSNPDSRRLMATAWNPSYLESSVLPPCHYGFQIYTRELREEEKTGNYKRAISLMWSQRSVDTGLGLPYNIASYGLLLKMIADEVNMIPDELIGNLGDTHIYKDQIEGLKEQLTRDPFPLPKLILQDGIHSNCAGDFILQDYISHPKINLPLSN